ncbi:MAG: cell division protein ZapA [Clostridia bacterium]|nr:cell division protein ZapA [Clostridia bacterium]
MLNRVVVTIDGFDYTVVSEDSEEHIRKSAALVDQSIREVKASTPFSTLTSSVLAAMNIADRYYKAEASTDGLRMQIKDYAEECSRLRTEVARLKRELGRK